MKVAVGCEYFLSFLAFYDCFFACRTFFWSFVVLVETGGNGLTDALTMPVTDEGRLTRQQEGLKPWQDRITGKEEESRQSSSRQLVVAVVGNPGGPRRQRHLVKSSLRRRVRGEKRRVREEEEEKRRKEQKKKKKKEKEKSEQKR